MRDFKSLRTDPAHVAKVKAEAAPKYLLHIRATVSAYIRARDGHATFSQAAQALSFNPADVARAFEGFGL